MTFGYATSGENCLNESPLSCQQEAFYLALKIRVRKLRSYSDRGRKLMMAKIRKCLILRMH